MTSQSIIVVGAGVFGLWQALSLARAGHRVTLMEASEKPFADASSRLAGAMLAPDCEAESAPPIVRDEGRRGLGLWRETYPGVVAKGSLVVAHARDRSELARFARVTQRHTEVDEPAIAGLEADLAGRFTTGLHFADEAHVVTPRALTFLLDAVRAAGVDVKLGHRWQDEASDSLIVDCRGFAARDVLPDLRGVRGERYLVQTDEVTLQRPVRLLHPRQPLYVVPWDDGVFMIGATLIESEDTGPVTVRSSLEILGLAYALHPAFGEAQVIENAAGLRPAFADNVPRVVICEAGRRLVVNGAWRHGFLLAPILAEAVQCFLTGAPHALLRLDS